MHHSEQKCAHFFSEWYIVTYDIWNRWIIGFVKLVNWTNWNNWFAKNLRCNATSTMSTIMELATVDWKKNQKKTTSGFRNKDVKLTASVSVSHLLKKKKKMVWYFIFWDFQYTKVIFLDIDILVPVYLYSHYTDMMIVRPSCLYSGNSIMAPRPQWVNTSIPGSLNHIGWCNGSHSRIGIQPSTKIMLTYLKNSLTH